MKKLIILFAIALLGVASCATNNSPKDDSAKYKSAYYWTQAEDALRDRRFEDAIQYFRYYKASSHDPNAAIVSYYNMGIIYAENIDNPSKAIFCYNKYLELAPADAPDREKVKQWIDNCQKRLEKR